MVADIADYKALILLDPATWNTNRVTIDHIGMMGFAISPDAKFALTHLTLSHPMGYGGYPTIVSLADPKRRYYLEGFSYKYDWTSAPGLPKK